VETVFVLSALKLVGYGLGVIGAGIGIGIACYGCCTASARQPELAGRLFTNFIIGAALVEALGLIGFVMSFLV
jgi:F-type H+-transporting ATPase subunit c